MFSRASRRFFVKLIVVTEFFFFKTKFFGLHKLQQNPIFSKSNGWIQLLFFVLIYYKRIQLQKPAEAYRIFEFICWERLMDDDAK